MNSKVLLASITGTILEFYNIALYATFAPVIALYYFPPTHNKDLALLTYALSFLMRPIGAVMLGYIGDKYGRKKAFALPLILMGFFSLLTILIPSYEKIGITASILVILCRIGQGFSLGAGFGGGLVLSLENSKNKHGIVAGLLGSSVLLGYLLANVVSFLLASPIFPTSFWKIAFILGAFISVLGIWIQCNLKEAPLIYSNIPKIPISTILTSHVLSVMKASAASGLTGLLGSFVFVYINFLLVTYVKWSLSQSLLLISFAHIVAILLAPIGGSLSQKYGALKIMKYSGFSALFSLLPALYLINTHQFTAIILAVILLSFIIGITAGSGSLLLYHLFPASVRYTGVAFSDSLGKILFSAFIPFLCHYLVLNNNYMASGLIPSSFILIILLIFYFPSLKKSQEINE